MLIWLWNHDLSFIKCVCVYIYIYIYCHPQTDCFILSELLSVARHIGPLSRDWNPSYIMLDLISDHSANKITKMAKGIIRYYIETAAAAAASICLHFLPYWLPECFRRALHYTSGGRKFLRQSAHPPWK